MTWLSRDGARPMTGAARSHGRSPLKLGVIGGFGKDVLAGMESARRRRAEIHLTHPADHEGQDRSPARRPFEQRRHAADLGAAAGFVHRFDG